jgi:hypothetical protein
MSSIRLTLNCAGVHTTQRNESINSLIKGGTVFANALQDMSFYHVFMYLIDIQSRHMEKELDEITELLQKKQLYCKNIHNILLETVRQCVDTCCGDSGWRIVPIGNNCFKVDATSGVEHSVTMTADTLRPIFCTCHNFTRMEITCEGVAAVLKSKKESPYDVKWLPQQWRLEFHPLFNLAMQRLCPSIPSLGPDTDADDSAERGVVQQASEDTASSNLVSRFVRVSSIPVPTNATIRRAQMTHAFNDLRDTYQCAENTGRYQTVMACIFDLRAAFQGQPGQWLQEPSVDRSRNASYAGDILAPPPPNLSVSSHKKNANPTAKTQSAMTVGQVNKKRKYGQLPTVQDRREQSGDWSLYLVSDRKDGMFMCPVPNCMKKPIKDTDQSRYAHRKSQNHRDCLANCPSNPNIPSAHCDTQPPGIPDASASATGIPDASASDDDCDTQPPGIPDASASATGIPDASASDDDSPSKRPSNGASDQISDSFMVNIRQAAPFDSAKTPQQNAARLAAAAIDEMVLRRSTKSPSASSLLSRGHAWSHVNLRQADRLPFMYPDRRYDSSIEGQFKVNQYCDECTDSTLCSTHQAMASNDDVDLMPKHCTAMKAAGYCLVECGGNGDCFYHSMLFLARIYDRELYNAWHDHDRFRKQTCDKLLVTLVTCYITMFCLLMFLSILTMCPDYRCRHFACSEVITCCR